MATWKKIVTNSDSVDVLSDVDTTASAPSGNDVLKWNGSNWVPASEGDNLLFDSTSLVATPGTTVAIGSGTWQSAGNLSFELNLENGTANSGYVECTSAGFTNDQEAFTNFAYGDGNDAWCDNTNDAPYPSGVGATNDTYGWRHQFTSKSVSNGSLTATNRTDNVYFNNYLYSGVVTTLPVSENTIEALSNAVLSNKAGQNNSSSSPHAWAPITTAAAEWVCLAVPKRLGADVGLQFKDATTGLELAIATGFPQTVSITTNGYSEDYSVYISASQNIGEDGNFYAWSFVQ